MRFTHRLSALILAVGLALGLTACQSIPAKQKAVTSLSQVQNTLEVLQDAERRLCNPISFDADATKPILECVGPLAQTAQLTTAKHQTFAAGMAKAYNLQKRAAIALQAWNPGTPAPAELPGLQSQAQTLIDFLKALAIGADQKQLVAVAQTLLDEVAKVIAAVKS